MQTNLENENHKKWAKFLEELIPGEAKVFAYADEDESNSIAIFSSTNSEGKFAATIGLMEFDQSQNPQETIHSEVVMDARGNNEIIENVISTIGFIIGKEKQKIAPGVVFEDIIETYDSDLSVKHILFVPVFQTTHLARVDLQSIILYPLLACPITEEENSLVNEHGYEYLMQLWEDQKIDVLDWRRTN